MSSLTDIIFLLLIFFMLSSSLVSPNALNLKMPGRSNSKIVSTSKMDDVRISSHGNYYLNGKKMGLKGLERSLSKMARKHHGKKLDITISPDKNAPTEYVVNVMDIALRLNINGVLAMEEE